MMDITSRVQVPCSYPPDNHYYWCQFSYETPPFKSNGCLPFKSIGSTICYAWCIDVFLPLLQRVLAEMASCGGTGVGGGGVITLHLDFE